MSDKLLSKAEEKAYERMLEAISKPGAFDPFELPVLRLEDAAHPEGFFAGDPGEYPSPPPRRMIRELNKLPRRVGVLVWFFTMARHSMPPAIFFKLLAKYQADPVLWSYLTSQETPHVQRHQISDYLEFNVPRERAETRVDDFLAYLESFVDPETPGWANGRDDDSVAAPARPDVALSGVQILLQAQEQRRNLDQ